MSDINEENELVEIVGGNRAAVILNRNISDSTKRNYSFYINRLKLYLENHYPGRLNEENEIIIPIQTEVALGFMGHECVFSADDEEEIVDENNRKMKATSTVGGYRSAIKYLYNPKNENV
jgi:hypothetical protein